MRLAAALCLTVLVAACSGSRRGGPAASLIDGGGRSMCSGCPVGTRCDEMRGCVSSRPCERSSDCDDEDPCTASEWCDASIRTCVYEVLDGDGDGEPPRICGGNDCDDTDPGAGIGMEWCDGWDNDCDERIDEAATCGEGQVCRDGFCECTDSRLRECGSGCIDVQSDPENCGACFRSCGGSACVAGECDCGGLTFCSFECTDTQTDPFNCGACGVSCGGLGCTAGRCDSCGSAGQACCPGGTCSTGNLCSGSSCVACGAVGEPCCAASACSSGDCVDGTCTMLECREPWPAWPSAAFPRCSSSTYSCATACTDGPCISSCLNADTTPLYMGVDCADCYGQQVFYCASRTPCNIELEAYRCCAEMRCPAGSASTCPSSMCPTEFNAFLDCLDTRAPSCWDLMNATYIRRCFP